MGPEPIRVLCVDDSPKLTAAWQRLISMQTDMRAIGGLGSCDTLVEFLGKDAVDVVLLDLTMDGRDPLDAMGEVHTRFPATRVLIYSGMNDPESSQRAIDAGAWGFINKLEEPSRVLDAIRRVARGEVVLPT